MTTNTGHKHISRTEDGYVVTLPRSYAELINKQTITKPTLADAIAARNLIMGAEGVNLDTMVPTLKEEFECSPLRAAGEWTFGALGDNHAGNITERWDVIEQIFDVFEERGVEVVYHTGNMLDGDKFPDLTFIRGQERQVNYFTGRWPRREGIITKFIVGDDHEGWYIKNTGVNIGKAIEDRARSNHRDDLKYIGYIAGDDTELVGGKIIKVRLMHPGGGTATQISLKSQQLVDRTSDYDKPHVLLVGHYHKAHHLPAYKGVDIFQTGCLCDATAFMRKTMITPMIGAWVITVRVSETGTVWTSGEFLPFKPRPWTYGPGEGIRA